MGQLQELFEHLLSTAGSYRAESTSINRTAHDQQVAQWRYEGMACALVNFLLDHPFEITVIESDELNWIEHGDQLEAKTETLALLISSKGGVYQLGIYSRDWKHLLDDELGISTLADAKKAAKFWIKNHKETANGNLS